MDKLERVAERLHEAWCDYQIARGRVLGPKRTDETHPHLLPWARLDLEAQNQDRYIAAHLLARAAAGELVREQLPSAIHDIWVQWEVLHGNVHPHALPFAVAHSHGADEHPLQADRVSALLGLP
jgi:hypothetical protein